MIFLVDTSNGNSGFGIVSEFRVRITSLMLEAWRKWKTWYWFGEFYAVSDVYFSHLMTTYQVKHFKEQKLVFAVWQVLDFHNRNCLWLLRISMWCCFLINGEKRNSAGVQPNAQKKLIKCKIKNERGWGCCYSYVSASNMLDVTYSQWSGWRVFWWYW